MKFKVGDMVLIRSDLAKYKPYMMEGNSVEVISSPSMLQYKGRIATVTAYDHGAYLLDIDGGSYFWTDQMLYDVVGVFLKHAFIKLTGCRTTGELLDFLASN